MPKPNIDPAWLQQCPPLPPVDQTSKSGHLLWKKAVMLQYMDCRNNHNALIKTHK